MLQYTLSLSIESMDGRTLFLVVCSIVLHRVIDIGSVEL